MRRVIETIRTPSAAWRKHLLRFLAGLFAPLLVGAGIVWAGWQSSDRLHQDTGVVVNLDEPASSQGRTFALGNQLAAQLVGLSGPNFTWRFDVTPEQARDGLNSGRYAVAVVIPKNFSASLVGKGNQKGVIDIAVSPVASASQRVVASTLTEAAKGGIGSQLGQSALNNVYFTFTHLENDLVAASELAQGAVSSATSIGQLVQEATTQTTDVVSRTVKVSTDIAQVANVASEVQQQAQAASNAGNTGAVAAAAARAQAAQHVADATALQSAVGNTSSSLGAALTQASTSAGNASALTSQLQARSDALRAQALSLSTTATSAQKNVAQLQALISRAAATQDAVGTTLSALHQNTVDYVATVQATAQGIQRQLAKAAQVQTVTPPSIDLSDSTQRLRDVAAALDAPIGQLRTLQGQLASDTSASDDLITYAANLKNWVKPGDVTCPYASDDEDRSAKCDAYLAGYRAAQGDAKGDIDGLWALLHGSKAPTVATTTRAADLKATIDSIVAQQQALKDAAQAIDDQTLVYNQKLPTVTAADLQPVQVTVDALLPSGSLYDTGSSLATMAGTADSQLTAAGKAMSLLSDGSTTTALTAQTNQLATTAGRQAEQLSALQQQMGQMGTSLQSVAGEISSAKRTSQQLASQASQTVLGANGLAQALAGIQQQLTRAGQSTTSAVAGTSRVAQGAGQAATQAGAAASAAQTLQTTVQSATTQSHTLSEQTRRTVTTITRSSTVVKQQSSQQPLSGRVDTTSTDDGTGHPNIGWATALLAVAMWFGALAMFLIGRPPASEVRTSNLPPLRLIAKAFSSAAAIGVVQSLALTIVGVLVMDLGVVDGLATFLVLLLASIVFMAVNFVLVALFGVVGRVLATLLVIVTALSVLTDVGPQLFDTVRRGSPITPVLDALRAIATGGSGLWGALLSLLVWAVASVTLAGIVVLRARIAEPVRVQMDPLPA